MRHLTDEMLKSGERLLDVLRKRRFPFRAALWIHLEEAEEWQLLLAVPGVKAEGPRKFFKQIQSAVASEPNLPRAVDVWVVDARDPLVYGAGPPIKAADAAKHVVRRGEINWKDFDDAYIYPPATKRAG